MELLAIKQEIKNGNFSLSELNELSAFTNSVKTLSAKASISVGDNVWVVQKTKRTPGVVTKVNVKKAIVDMRGRSYNVPLSMIEVA
jgi:FKBP-type peptidyl-prolyl cis-trans isomerase 2|tara:strand:- start:1038 stop:1295 length:258 start_codon:yes stop_codon:yes gene_type:complete